MQVHLVYLSALLSVGVLRSTNAIHSLVIGPALLVAGHLCEADADLVFETLEFQADLYPMRPGSRMGEENMVTAGIRRMYRPVRVLNAVAKN